MTSRIPTIEETTLGVFLHDIGKFMQRAHGSVKEMDADARNLESTVLPVYQGRYTHKHALWTAAFFRWMEKAGEAGFPSGINHDAVYDVAAYHHKPSGIENKLDGFAWLSAEADRLSAGMDRKQKDEDAEAADINKAWDAFMKTPLQNPFGAVDIGLGRVAAGASLIPLTLLAPGEPMMPVPGKDYDKAVMPAGYKELWSAFQKDFAKLHSSSTAAFLESLLSLSERYCFAIPSSTIDQPDISLHDHHRAAAAVAGAMYQWHAEQGNLTDASKIKDRQLPKFRFLLGDLSGIQSTLFQMPNQQVRGVNKMLRARSFLFGMLLETAALELRNAMGLPVFSVLQCAGGRLVMLVGNTSANEDAFQKVRSEIEQWMFQRYRGKLSLNLCLTAPFSGNHLMQKDYHKIVESMRLAAEDAKQHPFSTCLHTVHRDLVYRDQTCSACGTRPWTENLGDAGDPVLRCGSCADENRLGGALPKAAALSWRKTGDTKSLASVKLFGGWQLHLHESPDAASFGAESAFEIYAPGRESGGKLPRRFLANYVPRLQPADLADSRYSKLSEEAKESEPGDLKLFEHIAADALEKDGDQAWKGRDHLAVLKADVDRLGQVFGAQSGASSLSRYAALSRMMDFFFTGYLHHRLSSIPEFRSTYTVYAGGDDLLLIGPWRQMISVAADLQHRFSAWTGNNPNITISAGLEMMKPNNPIQRVAEAAEKRLDRAKNGGRNQICLIQNDPLSWNDLAELRQKADELHRILQTAQLPTAFVYRMLHFDDRRMRSEGRMEKAPHGEEAWIDLEAASWRSQWAYTVARNVRDRFGRSRANEATELMRFLNSLLGLDADLKKRGGAVSAVVPLTLALYRHRG